MDSQLPPIQRLMNDYKLKKETNLLILGLDNAGKTTMINYLVGADNKNTTPTQGVNGKSIQHNGVTLNIYDLGGQKAIREYWKYYYDNNNDALIYVVDANDEGKIAECNESFQQLLNEEKLNMNDITGRDWSLYACSALKGTGVVDGIKWIFDKLKIN